MGTLQLSFKVSPDLMILVPLSTAYFNFDFLKNILFQFLAHRLGKVAIVMDDWKDTFVSFQRLGLVIHFCIWIFGIWSYFSIDEIPWTRYHLLPHSWMFYLLIRVRHIEIIWKMNYVYSVSENQYKGRLLTCEKKRIRFLICLVISCLPKFLFGAPLGSMAIRG